MDLNNWKIEWVADGSGNAYTISGVTIDPGQLIVFYESNGTSTANRVYMNTPIVWTDFIAVSLKDSAGNGVDFVRTGASVTTPPAPTSWTGANADNPASGSSTAGALSRSLFTADTDTAAEWSVSDDSAERMCRLTSETVCGSACVNLTNDRGNCGACGNVCGSGASSDQSQCVEQGAVRLAQVSGTDGISSGRVEVFQSGRWYAVGYDGSWGNTDATVACKQLGVSSGTGNTSTYGNCSDEPRLIDCPHSVTTTNYSGYRAFCSE